MRLTALVAPHAVLVPRYKKPFPFISDSRFSANSPDLGVKFFNVPADIAEANGRAKSCA